MPQVVIIGAGVMGASTAFHLTQRGVRDVLLLERNERPGQGSTAFATGGFRAQYATDLNVRLSLLARQQLRQFRELTSVDPGYAQVGYLWLAQSADDLASLRRAQLVQHAAGLVEAQLLSTGDAARLNPAASLEGIHGAAFCPTDGYIRPLEILRGFLEAAQRGGARLRCSARPAAITARSVTLQDGEVVEAEHVVNAAGPWAAQVARLAGVDLPVSPLRRQVACTAPVSLPVDMPMTLWTGDGFHLRVRDGRALLLLPTAGDPADPWSTQVEAAWLERVQALARERVPGLGEPRVEQSWAGLYEMSPDKHALLGRQNGLWLINGSSGHGVMHAPALGLLLAELITGAAPSLDVRPLRPARFAEGLPNSSEGVL